MHTKANVGFLIESVIFTKEKAEAMGIPMDIVPQGWWVGFQIHDVTVWEKIKNGDYSMFSIEGTATPVEVEDPNTPKNRIDQALEELAEIIRDGF